MDVILLDTTDVKTVLVVPVLKDCKEGVAVKDAYKKLGVTAYIARSGYVGEDGVTAEFLGDKGKIILYGLGEQAKLTHEKVRMAMGSICKLLQSKKLAEFAVLSVEGLCTAPVEIIARAQTEGLLLGGYSFTKYKSKADPVLAKATVCVLDKAKEWKTGYDLGKAIADLANEIRDVGNEPANVMTPEALAKKAKDLADRYKVGYKCLEPEQLKKEGMNCLLGVAQGSVHPPRLVIMEYLPKKGAPIHAVVGKGVCFDSGGISLKPGKGMEEMKFDMCGAAATMAIVSAAARLKLPVNVVGVMPMVENLPGSSAQRPGDIVKAASGKYVEVLNTDAEGRLILADALHYARKHYKPESIIDLATLTGACVVALGHVCSGMMGNSDALLADIKKASDSSGEKVWQLPLFDEYADDIKSGYADIKNLGAGDGAAGAITAAMFLKEFVDETPWVHLDIAGTAWTTADSSGYLRLGATGAGVRVVTQWLMDKAK
ncbi:leucyl aminopeptidase [Candidatus Woesearchaeota archaeon]|nr:leucyl aminopeptidase [Candidatus Woesearchaeota archaeon]